MNLFRFIVVASFLLLVCGAIFKFAATSNCPATEQAQPIKPTIQKVIV